MSLRFEPLKPQRTNQPWNRSAPVLESICSYLSVEDLCQFAQISKDCKIAAYNEKWWVERLRNLDLVDRISDETPKESLIEDELSPLDCIDAFSYSPNNARLGFMKLWRTLGPFYEDLASGTHAEPLAFQVFRDPIDQAKVLAQIRKFSACDPLETDHDEKISRLNSTIDLFENAALAEFELGYDEHDLEQVKRYARVLITLNGGDNCVQVFVQKNPLLNEKSLEKADDYFYDQKLDVKKFEDYLKNAATLLNAESAKIDQVFSSSLPVVIPLFERVLEDSIMELVSSILDKARNESMRQYLRIVPEIFLRLRWFRGLLENSENCPNFQERAQEMINDSYGLHVDQYLQEELQAFVDEAESSVEKWEAETMQQEQDQESFLWSNVAKAQDKSDFLSSFKKVLMMPVMPFQSSNASSTSVNNKGGTPNASTVSLPTNVNPQHAPSGAPHTNLSTVNLRPSSPNVNKQVVNPPTTELDAMVAVMNSKLENISSLFSLELALTIIRNGKDTIERIAKLVSIGGRTGKDVEEQCEQVFVELVRIVGSKHVKSGFDKALATLNEYDPRQYRKIIVDEDETKNAVEPLAIFAELVNIGDLIQQMIHVFFEEELSQRKFIDPQDFLSPAVKSKRRWEQTLDESVANGLNRGIDVLVDQIDFVFVTIQLGSDFNPDAAGFSQVANIGPTEAAKKVISLISSHVTLLQGSTEKSVIDVFQQEISMRFYASISKHIKRQTISVEGAITLISDLNYYYQFVLSLRQKEVLPYFEALKELGQLFLIDGNDAKALGRTLSDMSRFRGVMQPEEVFEFVQRRADWLLVRKEVEKVIYGFGVDCMMM